MSNTWVCKFDGTIQCEENSNETTLEDMGSELARIIGRDNIVNMEKRARTMPQMCGMPTGSVNAYEITEEGAEILNRGFVGRQGFEPCMGESQISLAQLIGTSTRNTPNMIRELVGRHLRVYKKGDALTEDWRPERVNIERDDDFKIVDIWFG